MIFVHIQCLLWDPYLCTCPVLIFQFSLGHCYNKAARSDPFAVMIPPVGKYDYDYALVLFESEQLDTRGEQLVFEAWINIAIPAEYDPSALRFDVTPRCWCKISRCQLQ